MATPTKFRNKWRIRWTDEYGDRKSECYDKYADAEFALKRHETVSSEIKRGLRNPTALSKTFSELCDYYLTHVSSQKRSARNDHSIIRNHLRPFFGKMSLVAVGLNIDEFKVAKSNCHPNTLHHFLTLLISMLRKAQEKRWLIELPIIKKPRVRIFDKDFRYLKNDDEIRKFLLAAHDEGPFAYAVYSFSLYTGVRPGELAGLKKSDINLSQRLISVERSFDGPTKNGEIRYVPILDSLLPILKEWLLKSPGPLLFPNTAGNMLEPRARIFSELFHRVLDASGFPRETVDGRLRHYLRYYDLRHTFASTWMRNSGNLFKLSKILGHKTIQMTMRYAHLQPDVYAEDYGRLGRHHSFDATNTIMPFSPSKTSVNF